MEYVVVIPVHNGEKTIVRAIKSALNQTLPPTFIQVFDNSSTDSTAKLVKDLINSYPSLRLIQSTSKLESLESFRSSLANLHGKFIWLAADDLLLPDAISDLWKAKCNEFCQHTIAHRVVFFDNDLNLKVGKNFSEVSQSEQTVEKYLEFPADNSLFYSLVEVDVARKCLPKSMSYAWDWVYTTKILHESGIHYQNINVGLLRETSERSSYQNQVKNQSRLLDRLFPLVRASVNIVRTPKIISWRLIKNLMLLNAYSAIYFGTLSQLVHFKQLNFTRVLLQKVLSLMKSQLRRILIGLSRIYKRIEPILGKTLKTRIREQAKSSRRGWRFLNSRFKNDINNEIISLKGFSNSKSFVESLSPFRETSKEIQLNPFEFLEFTDFITLVQFLSAKTKTELIVVNNFKAENHARIFRSLIDYGLIKNVRIIDSKSDEVPQGYVKTVSEIAFAEWSATFENLAADAVAKSVGTQKSSIRVLVCLAEIPDPNRDSGSNLIICYLAIMKKLGYKITVCVPHKVSDVNSLLLLESMATVKTYSEIDSTYASIVVYGPYAFLYFEKLDMFQDYIYIMIDAVFRRYEQSKSLMNSDDLTILQFETKAIVGAKVSFAISNSDIESCRLKYPNSRFELFPIIRRFEAVENRSYKVLNRVFFVGSMRHTPNKLAAEFILREIVPNVTKLNSGIIFTFVGYGTEDLENDSKNVELLGSVKDLESVYQDSFVSLAPMQVAAGINGKVLESIGYGLISLISKPVSFNLSPNMRRCTIECDSAEDYVREIINLFLNPKFVSEEDRKMVEVEIDGALNAELLWKNLA